MLELLIQSLIGGANPIWPTIWRQRVREAVARQALAQLDCVSGMVRERWRLLDESRERERLLSGTPDLWNALTDLIVRTRRWRDTFNAELRANSMRQVNATQFRNAVYTVVPVVIRRPESQAIVRENPFPATWALLANSLAGEVHQRTQPSFPEREWALLQSLLLVGFFSTCRLPEARQVGELFRAHQAVILSVRGAFLRIPERIGPGGVLDRPVSLSPRAAGPIRLTTASLSPLVQATELEVNQTLNGQGLLHRLIPVGNLQNMPLWDMGALSASQLAAGRDASYRLYEWTIVTFLALSAIEFVLRTWAQHRIMNAGTQVAIVKPNGQPNGVLDWIEDLGCGQTVQDAVEELYSPDKTNIRNRVLHGNLFEIHSKRTEVHLPIGDQSKYGWLTQESDPYHPENIALHCLRCLELIDSEMAQVAIATNDMNWTQGVMLTQAEIEFGLRVYCDFLGPDREKWLATVTDYLNAVMPSLKQLFAIGFVEWLRGQITLNPVLSMVMGYSYEAIHRLTVHLINSDVCGLSGGTVQKSHEQNQTVSHFQYRMLDTRFEGLFSAKTLAVLLDHVPACDRDTARQAFELAMKARNALAHGALIRGDQQTLDGMGHLFAKAIQTLVTAGLHHLVQKAAYFIYRNEHPTIDGMEEGDWLRAEKEVCSRIARIARQDRWQD